MKTGKSNVQKLHLWITTKMADFFLYLLAVRLKRKLHRCGFIHNPYPWNDSTLHISGYYENQKILSVPKMNIYERFSINI